MPSPLRAKVTARCDRSLERLLNRGQKLFLARETPVDGADRDLRLGRDRRHGEVVELFPLQHLLRGGEYTLQRRPARRWSGGPKPG